MDPMKKKTTAATAVAAAQPIDQRKFVGVSFRTRTADGGALQARLDRCLAAMAKLACGVAPKMNSLAKSAFERGLSMIEKELGIS